MFPQLFNVDVNWNFLSLALFANNSDLFNNLVVKYKPLLGMLFTPAEKTIKDADYKDAEYASVLEALISDPSDHDRLFNMLENHPEVFTFKEIISILKRACSIGGPELMVIFNSRGVKSWFNWMHNEERKESILNDLIDLAEENEHDMMDSLGPQLVKPTYREVFESEKPDLAEQYIEQAEVDTPAALEASDDEEDASEKSEEGSEADDASDVSDASSGDDDAASESYEGSKTSSEED